MADRNIVETVDFFIEVLDERDLNIGFLVENTNLNRKTITNFLGKKWKSCPKYDTAEEIAHALGYELSEVLRKDDSELVALDPVEIERRRKFQCLSPERQKLIDEMLNQCYENEINSINKK
ncbi:hypothetical protein [Butyrivibrio sp. VCD2006]|uniref:hypothetical protein n=1 Tax=Butyrivibrio sp. VCD2006 TaxID=1280664 RepID=UPI000423AA97|nr:hypothetical protein [Butyrivibrio sp. VCD2006]